MRTVLAALGIIGLASAGLSQCPLQKVTGTPGAADDLFGGSGAAISGDTAVINAPGEPAAYVFVKSGGSWVQQARLTPSVMDFSFGAALAISGDTILVGSRRGLLMSPVPGSVYVFQRNAGIWTQQTQLDHPEADTFDAFGSSGLALSGSMGSAWAAIGDTLKNGNLGKVYLFEAVGFNWIYQETIEAPNPLPSLGAAHFGSALALQGDRLVVGAASDAQAGLFAGKAFVYERMGGLWNLDAELLPSNLPFVSQIHFGGALALDADTLVIGAAGPQGNVGLVGRAYVWRRDPVSGWIEDQQLMAANAQANDQFAAAVALRGDRIAVGAPRDDQQATDAGATYVFRRGANNVWGEVDKLFPTAPGTGDRFGSQVGLSLEALVASAPRDDTLAPDAGAAYFLNFSGVPAGACALGAPCGNSDPVTGCVNSTGLGAALNGCGSTSVLQDDLALGSHGLPASVSLQAFMGAGLLSIPFGDGIRAAVAGGVGVFRFAPDSSSALGLHRIGPGIIAQTGAFPPLGQIAAGQTWHFQVWYRDLTGPCATGVNFTNAVSISFVP